MPIDKFGHYIGSSERYQNLHSNIHVDSDRNFNFHLRRIKNIANPVLENDGVNKIYLKSYFEEQMLNQNVSLTEQLLNLETRLSKLIQDQSILQNNLDQSLKEVSSLHNYKIEAAEERFNKTIQDHYEFFEARINRVERNSPSAAIKRMKAKVIARDGETSSGTGTP